MKTMSSCSLGSHFRVAASGLVGVLCSSVALAVTPTVKVVPWVASDSTVPHNTYSGRMITLQGTANVQGANFQWTWDFGDGSPVATGTVADPYVIEAKHAYVGADGTLYTAHLTVVDTGTSESASKPYYVLVKAKSLQIEVNVAIDEGLWWLHKDMTRWNDGTVGLGDWDTWKNGYSSGLFGYYGTGSSLSAQNVCAFETQGHLEIGSSDDPYTETVQRGLRRVFQRLTTQGIPPLKSIPSGTYLEDINGNGTGVCNYDGNTLYQGGMYMDCIIASGTPNAITATGPSGIVGRKYSDIVQDMVDFYLWAQYTGSGGGGWRYNPGDYPDNSVCQWAAIGLIPAEREWGLTVPQWMKDWNVVWLLASQDEGWWGAVGSFLYQPGWNAWSYYATTPSGMVQLCMDGIGRGAPGWPSWDAAETFMRNNWESGVKGYYYGLFSFVKSMLLHAPGGVPAPISASATPPRYLQSSTPGVVPLDWYGAEIAKGDPSDGVARTLVNGQSAAGYWWGHNLSTEQYYYETAWAIQMLSQTIFRPGGAPVAVPVAIPNPGVVNGVITLDGSGSYDKAPGHTVVKWEWDVTNDGIFEGSGVTIQATFASLGIYPVKLRVTDDSSPPLTGEAAVNVAITIPPVAPTANASGPYVFCPQATPWFLEGRMSVNPDDGKHDPGPYPGDKIQSYLWDLNGDNVFGDATGSTPDVTAYFQALGPGSYVVQLKVTDTTSLSFPSSGMGDLSSIASATIVVKAATDPECCACVTLSLVADGSDVQLSWTALPGAATYGVYRSTTHGGPYALIGSSTGINYTDDTPVSGTTYYYVVRPAALNGNELCQSNEISVTPTCDPPTVRWIMSTKVSNNPKYYRQVFADSNCFDEVAMKIYIGDTLTPSFKAGPYKDEDVLRIAKGALATVKPGSLGTAGNITVKGQATVWCVDPFGTESAHLTITTY
jgi:hypothetical protein